MLVKPSGLIALATYLLLFLQKLGDALFAKGPVKTVDNWLGEMSFTQVLINFRLLFRLRIQKVRLRRSLGFFAGICWFLLLCLRRRRHLRKTSRELRHHWIPKRWHLWEPIVKRLSETMLLAPSSRQVSTSLIALRLLKIKSLRLSMSRSAI